MRNQRAFLDKIEQIFHQITKKWLIGKEGIRQAVHRLGFRRHGSFWIIIGVIDPASLNPVDQFHTSDFNKPIA